MVQIVVMIVTSRIIPMIRRFKWILVAGPCFIAIGSGLLYSVDEHSPLSHVYGYMVLIGAGIGMTLQNSMVCIQFDLRAQPRLITMGTGIGTFIGFAGRIIGLSLAGSVFENMIKVNLHKYVPELPEEIVHAMSADATTLWTAVPEALRPATLHAYSQTVKLTFLIGVPGSILAVLGGLIVRNDKMPTKAEEAERVERMKAAEAAGGDASKEGSVGAAEVERREKKDPEA